MSYVPRALGAGAVLYTETSARRILSEGGAVRGVLAEPRGRGGGRRAPRLRVRARAVAVGCGALLSPGLLRRSGLARGRRWLGRNLVLQPATKVMALFDEEVRGWEGIPQGYSIDEFAPRGVMLETAFGPPDLLSVGFQFSGRPFVQAMERFRNLVVLGILIADSSRGRIVPMPGRRGMIFYDIGRDDLDKLRLGIQESCRMLLAAGAKRVFTPVAGFDEISGRAELERLRSARIRTTDLEVGSVHPMGTLRMGTSPRRSVVGPDNQLHGTAGLFVVDGSAIPTSLGVNPQLTIMALATRAADHIDEFLSGCSGSEI